MPAKTARVRLGRGGAKYLRQHCLIDWQLHARKMGGRFESGPILGPTRRGAQQDSHRTRPRARHMAGGAKPIPSCHSLGRWMTGEEFRRSMDKPAPYHTVWA